MQVLYVRYHVFRVQSRKKIHDKITQRIDQVASAGLQFCGSFFLKQRAEVLIANGYQACVLLCQRYCIGP